MMEFIVAPLIVWICVSGVYNLFELFARRKERMAIIEKLSEKSDVSFLVEKLNRKNGLSNPVSTSFNSLKIGCLLVGLGLGLLVGLIITTNLVHNGYNMHDHQEREIFGGAYGASVLLFGGLGLLISFLIEIKLKNNNKA